MEVDQHEHTFAEECEPSGRLILTPCMTCGLTGLEAIEESGSRLAEINTYIQMLEEFDNDPYDERTLNWVADFLTVLLEGARVRDVLRLDDPT